MPWKTQTQRPCKRCGKDFLPTSASNKFCGILSDKESCMAIARRDINKVASSIFLWRNPGYKKKSYNKGKHRYLAKSAENSKWYKRGECRCHLCPVHGPAKVRKEESKITNEKTSINPKN